MTKTKRIILISICSLLIVATMVAMIFAAINYYGGKNKAHADYLDLAETNTLVNFNQYVPNANITMSSIPRNQNGFYNIYNTSSFTFYANHKYYIFGTNTSSYAVNVCSGSNWTNFSSAMVIENGFTSKIYTTDVNRYGLQLYTDNNNASFKNFNIIDLTQMFGSNEPNLEQAQEYFTAAYYNYTTGTLLPYSKDYLQGYQDGANDLLEAMTITYNSFTIGISSTTYSNNIIDRGEFGFSETEGYYYFSGVIGINLQAIVERGTNFDVDYQFLIPDFSGESQSYKLSYKLHFAYVDDNNNLIDIVEITPTNEGNYNTYNGSFVLPVSTSKIYCYVNDGVVSQDNQATLQCFAFKSDLTFKSTDVALLMSNAYQRGYSDMQERYNINGDLYNEIWTLGYNNGLAQQNATIGTMDYAKAAFIGIGEILKIELLPGVPFSLFVLLPLMLGLITFVVRLSKGGD